MFVTELLAVSEPPDAVMLPESEGFDGVPRIRFEPNVPEVSLNFVEPRVFAERSGYITNDAESPLRDNVTFVAHPLTEPVLVCVVPADGTTIVPLALMVGVVVAGVVSTR